ncbi:hypothetical protein T484DRAFT_1822147, partial [Baffinella frigidus]
MEKLPDQGNSQAATAESTGGVPASVIAGEAGVSDGEPRLLCATVHGSLGLRLGTCAALRPWIRSHGDSSLRNRWRRLVAEWRRRAHGDSLSLVRVSVELSGEVVADFPQRNEDSKGLVRAIVARTSSTRRCIRTTCIRQELRVTSDRQAPPSLSTAEKTQADSASPGGGTSAGSSAPMTPRAILAKKQAKKISVAGVAAAAPARRKDGKDDDDMG